MSHEVVAVFARAPELGKVKTRLAAEVGDEAALAAHCALVEHTLREVRAPGSWSVELWIAGPLDTPELGGWAELVQGPLVVQSDGDLGVRMASCLETLLARGRRVVLIGCDCPPIDADYLRAAFELLETRNLVLGPAEDGGYGLIGMRDKLIDVFTDIPWGTPRVLEQTLERAQALGVSVGLLPVIWDVDDRAGWERFRRS